MSDITQEQVAHLAHLARIDLAPSELTRLTGELVQIMHAVQTVSEVATAEVPATSHPVPLQNVFRPDVVGATLTAEQALASAPEHDGSRFKVSAILDEEQ